MRGTVRTRSAGASTADVLDEQGEGIRGEFA